MLTADLIRISLRQIYRNKRRYKSALVGTALGIAGLITVVTMGESVEGTMGRNLEVLGSATIVKAQWEYRGSGKWHIGEFTDKDVSDLRCLPDALDVAPATWQAKQEVSFGKKKVKAMLGGIDPSFFEAVYMPVVKGRRINGQDIDQRRQVVVIGQQIEDDFFGPERDSLGKMILIHGHHFEVVGVLGGVIEDPMFLSSCLMPLTVARLKMPNMKPIQHIYVRGKDWDCVPELHRQVREVLTTNQPGYAPSMSIFYYESRIKAIKTIVVVFKFFLYAAIGVTLILGGLGITNVMLAVVNERTTEIGLRKAVGATEGMIISQFLCESLVVSGVGSGLGILCGTASIVVLQRVFGTPAALDVFLVSLCGSVVIAVILGVASGILPAWRAGRMSAVEAMRFE